jgi:hypothetical protein
MDFRRSKTKLIKPIWNNLKQSKVKPDSVVPPYNRNDMAGEIIFGSDHPTDEELKMLMTFCEEFGINIVIKADATEIIVHNPTELQKALLQGFYYGITGKRLNFDEE